MTKVSLQGNKPPTSTAQHQHKDYPRRKLVSTRDLRAAQRKKTQHPTQIVARSYSNVFKYNSVQISGVGVKKWPQRVGKFDKFSMSNRRLDEILNSVPGKQPLQKHFPSLSASHLPRMSGKSQNCARRASVQVSRGGQGLLGKLKHLLGEGGCLGTYGCSKRTSMVFFRGPPLDASFLAYNRLVVLIQLCLPLLGLGLGQGHTIALHKGKQ